MQSHSRSARPLSPHLQIYRWQYTMTLSILHRITGCAMSVGLVLFVYWLLSIADGPQSYERAMTFFAHPLVRVLLVGFSFAFFYHLANGIRHLVWDMGYGLERREARTSGWVAFLSAVAVTILFWIVVAVRHTGDIA
ncbi:MAG: succinate dehydrogenase, cytochrome b556 subunit [Gammaproteobacteria bacterium]|nr:succinate dehydrogenase, cytochrome b556 subunit [Gammaproteobacteria bacterium]